MDMNGRELPVMTFSSAFTNAQGKTVTLELGLRKEAVSRGEQTLMSAIGNVLIFAAIGIAAAIIGFKLFDVFTPGNLQKEIIENKNIAAAILAAAAILGVSIIIAASMLG